MVLKATINKAQLRRARDKLLDHPWNNPGDVALKAAKKAMPKIAQQVKAGAPRRTGKLKKSLKGVARKNKDTVIVGVQFKFYGIFLNKRSKFISRQMKPADVVKRIAEEVKG